jgi:hypothetical protein
MAGNLAGKRIGIAGVTAAVVVGGGMLVRQLRAARPPSMAGGDTEDRRRDTRWLAVTVDREPDQVAPGGQLPEPLAALGDRIETRARPAPGGKGTELAARLRTPGNPGDNSTRQELRAALRRSKQLIEVGEVLALEPVPHGERTATPAGRALEAVTRRADREGVL